MRTVAAIIQLLVKASTRIPAKADERMSQAYMYMDAHGNKMVLTGERDVTDAS